MLTKNLQVIFINYQYYNFKLFFARKWCYNKLKPFSSNFSFRRVRGWRGGVGDNSSAITYFFYPLFGGGLVDAPQIGQSYLLLLVLVFFLLTKVKQHTQSEIVEKVKEGQRRSEKVRGHLARMSDHDNTRSYLLFSKLMYIVKLLKHLT